MNLSKFKKVHESDDHAILEHPEGHQITVAKRSISPKLKKDLASLPMCGGGEVQKFDDGGPVLDAAPYDPLAQVTAPLPSDQQYTPQPFDVTAGLKPTPLPSQVQAPPPQETGPQAQPQMPQQMAPQASQQSQDPFGYGAEGNMYKNAYGMGAAGIQGAAKAAGDLGKQQAAIEQKSAEQQQQNLDVATKTMADIQGHIQATTQDIQNGHIDPKHYMENMGSGQKIATAIGLILGGIGGGASGQGNPAMDFLNKQIDRDIESQKANMDKQKTLLGAFQQQYGNAQVAEDMTKLTLAKITESKINQQIALAQTPIQKAAGQQALAKWQAEYAPLMQQATMRQMALGVEKQGQNGQPSQVDPASLVPSLVPKEHQKEAFDAIKEAQAAAKYKNELLDDFDTAAKQTRFLSGARPLYSTVTEPPTISDMGAKEMGIIHADVGRVTPEERKAVAEAYHPKAWDDDATVAKKRKGYEEFLNGKINSPVNKGYGIDLSRFKSTIGSPDQGATQIKTMNGVEYKQGISPTTGKPAMLRVK